MVKLSTKGRYGLRAMYQLATSWGQGPVLMSDIAEDQGYSRKYLHALLTSLRESGLVHSVRGAKGGYLLARPPEEIRLDEIIESLEGPIVLVHCVDDKTKCERSSDCVVKDLWKDLTLNMVTFLHEQTLADLVSRKHD